MEAWITQFISELTYIGVATVLIASGFGLPLPEDLPLLLGGFMCAKEGGPELRYMLPLAFVCVIGGDLTVYTMGRKIGPRITASRFFGRFLTPGVLAKAQQLIDTHGGKILFIARFMPGLRTPIFFTAGTFKLPLWKMFLYDGSAALLSVPLLVLLGWFFHTKLDVVLGYVRDTTLGALLVVGLGIAAVVIWKVRRKRRNIQRPAAREPLEKSE